MLEAPRLPKNRGLGTFETLRVHRLLMNGNERRRLFEDFKSLFFGSLEASNMGERNNRTGN